MKKCLCTVFIAMIGVIIGLRLPMYFSFKGYPKHSSNSETGLTYADIAAINQTAVTIILAVVTLIISFVAIFGYHAVIEAAEQKIKDELPNMLKAELEKMRKNGSLAREIERVNAGTYEEELE